MEQIKRIVAFLSEYLQANDGSELPVNQNFAIQGIWMLITQGIMTKDEIKQECLLNYNVIVPEEYFDGVMVDKNENI